MTLEKKLLLIGLDKKIVNAILVWYQNNRQFLSEETVMEIARIFYYYK